jgi:hypothetical protein
VVEKGSLQRHQIHSGAIVLNLNSDRFTVVNILLQSSELLLPTPFIGAMIIHKSGLPNPIFCLRSRWSAIALKILREKFHKEVLLFKDIHNFGEFSVL